MLISKSDATALVPHGRACRQGTDAVSERRLPTLLRQRLLSRTILTGLTVTAQPIISQTTREKLRVVARPQASLRRIGCTDSSPTTVENRLAGVTRLLAAATPVCSG